MDVISIGEAMVLFTPETSGPMRYARDYTSRIAGAEINTLIGLAKLEHETGWISRVGSDEFGAMLKNAVRGEGVDVSEVAADDEAPTGIFFKENVYGDHVRVHYYRKHSAASFLNPESINEAYLSEGKVLYITGITPALSDSCSKAVFQAIEIAKKHKLTIVFDPNIRYKLWTEEKARNTILEIAGHSDIVFPGTSEGEFLFGTSHPEKIADALHELGPDTIVVKKGEEGAYYSCLSKKEQGHAEGFRVKQVIDPVGAGDGFAAGVVSGLLDGLSLKESVTRGCAIGAMVTMVNGDIEGLPDRKTLELFLSSKSDVSR
ncbi:MULTISPECIES: sugar kinase [Fictibacillus]|uniref:2-dehydro-3-deoxygluconokinase n=1 Tax=Fictibacillus enclensis TaxID=1017270 RepID=A0A0V8JBB5_9BACL|nr:MULTISPECIES: sugar kinase [Fictibacillus]KSU84267.1 2-dehydro-3-deoxygluconokinase [Fictibacillus enclensis]RXZ00117.1 sugar kinase [Fictibacillus sp. S7]SCB76172.1 2-dehydro-3-deoxygluconokinase [Fictibacillus enclensis]